MQYLDKTIELLNKSYSPFHVVNNIKEELDNKIKVLELDIFTDYEKQMQIDNKITELKNKEDNVRRAVLTLKNKYGKNTVVKASDLVEGATQIERNNQIGGHKA